jgi:hypothetical protein
LSVYVARYGVELPEEFVSHAQINNYEIPADLEVRQFVSNGVSFKFWLEWCAKKKAQREQSERIIQG